MASATALRFLHPASEASDPSLLHAASIIAANPDFASPSRSCHPRCCILYQQLPIHRSWISQLQMPAPDLASQSFSCQPPTRASRSCKYRLPDCHPPPLLHPALAASSYPPAFASSGNSCNPPFPFPHAAAAVAGCKLATSIRQLQLPPPTSLLHLDPLTRYPVPREVNKAVT